MTIRSWSSTKAVKIWLDVVLLLGGLASAALLIWAMAAPMVMGLGEGSPADFGAPVVIGASSMLPILELEFEETAAAAAPRFHRARLLHARGQLRAETFDWRLHLTWLGIMLAGLLVSLWAVWNLRQVVRTTLAGEPFAVANVRRLRRIAWAILATAALAPLAEFQLGRYLLEQLAIESPALSPALHFSKDWFLGGLLFLVLSSIFRHGAELEKERALTV